MKRVDLEKEKILFYLKKIEFLNSITRLEELNINSNNMCCVKAILAFSLYPHIVRIDKKNKIFSNE